MSLNCMSLIGRVGWVKTQICTMSLFSVFFSRDSDLTSDFWDVDILKWDVDILSKDVDILNKMWIYY